MLITPAFQIIITQKQYFQYISVNRRKCGLAATKGGRRQTEFEDLLDFLLFV